MSLRQTRLTTTYPCCGQVARFVALGTVPAERYDRLCQRCGQKWDVRRVITARTAGVRIDTLTWSRAGLHRTASDRNVGERFRSTGKNGSVYVLYDAIEAGIDAGGEWTPGVGGGVGLPGEEGWKVWRWATVCEAHGTVCGHPTLALARSHLSGGEWCEECRDER
jgi:hypothetical protein